MIDEQPRKLLTSGEAAAALGVTVRTLHRWEADGRIPRPVRTPTGHRRYDAAEIAALLKATA